MWQWFLVFIVNILLDITYTQYTIQSARLNTLKAACWSVVMGFFIGANVLSFVHDPWLLIPAAVGAFVGTWAAIDFQRFIDKRDIPPEPDLDENCS